MGHADGASLVQPLEEDSLTPAGRWALWGVLFVTAVSLLIVVVGRSLLVGDWPATMIGTGATIAAVVVFLMEGDRIVETGEW